MMVLLYLRAPEVQATECVPAHVGYLFRNLDAYSHPDARDG